MSTPISDVAISLPFQITAFGKVNTTSDQSKIWQDRVKGVIGTIIGERVMRPTFGSKVGSQVFEDVDDLILNLEAAASKAFSSLLPSLTLEDVSVSFDTGDKVASVDITYSLPDKTFASASVAVATVSPSYSVIEEVQ